ncbi:MAG: YqgE/AlgH family protein, partial [Pseudomonadota bacterium]|nr:YqgE/AlgH family protein [Pseudomonadota bacterium]
GEILEQLDMHGGELDLPVYTGGPVQPERGFVLHSPGRQWKNTARVTDGVFLTTSRDILESIGRDEGPESFLVALGYSGWGEGQLEEELGSNAWLTCPASTDILFRTPADQRYQAVLRLMGIDLNQLSDSVGHA